MWNTFDGSESFSSASPTSPAAPDADADFYSASLADDTSARKLLMMGRLDLNSFIPFQIWDVPGTTDIFENQADAEALLLRCGALVFVIDGQDDYLDALQKLFVTIIRGMLIRSANTCGRHLFLETAQKINPSMFFEVLIHKVDGLSYTSKIEAQRDIHQRIFDELSDVGLDHVNLFFYLTSIYDYSIYEAFSKIIQKLIPQLPTLENLLNIFCSSSGIEKAFLFDVHSKIYVATDSSPVDIQTYELCSDVIDVFLDISSIYDTSPDTGAGGQGSLDKLKRRHDSESYSLVKLKNGMVLYSRALLSGISCVCLLKSEDSFDRQLGIIDYNAFILKDAVQQVYELAIQM
ncbi:MAG: hypothetical protein SGCHY_004997 [Lobulomycetales sp.]